MDREYGRSVRTVYKENGKIDGHRSSFHRCEMMKRRSKLEIYLDLLKAVSETGRLTHIGKPSKSLLEGHDEASRILGA